jgi:hypothetical protein
MHAYGRLVPALAVALWASEASAQTRDAAGAEWLFREGRVLMKQGDLAAACPKLAESLRFDPAVGTLMNLAECEERQGRTASAWQRWGAAADQLPANDRRRATALARARALEATLPRLTIETGTLPPAGLQVIRDGVPLGIASLGVALPVDPGPHLIVVSAPGRAIRRYEVSVEGGKQQVLVVEPGPAPSPVAVPAPVPAAAIVQPAPPAERRSGRGIGYGLLAGGAGALAVGTYFGVQALAARGEAGRDCKVQDSTHRCWSSAAGPLEQDRRDSLIADVAFAAGTLATASGLYLVWRRWPSRSVTASVAAGPRTGGMEIAGSF